MPPSRCSVPTSAAPRARACSTDSLITDRARGVKWGKRAARSSRSGALSAVSRMEVTRRTACSSARWHTAETGTPAFLTASASSSGR
ncbi:hypothetical protein ACFPKZ_44330 [Streptosporangium amethystogenes subsp. fukuiense]|uniref:hypothetical protein n=1 Tax=Streptosporangium amethystogenes TaxID=2002 RepID=UPI0036151AA1